MKAVITGAGSGIGADIARVLHQKGYDLILIDVNKNNLNKMKEEFGNNVQIINTDLASTFNCMKLVHKLKKENIDVLVNSAGFGLYGSFSSTSLDKELDMIDLNIKSIHTLTKEFLKYFKEKDSGFILNISFSPGFIPGPNMANYFATKSYIYNLTMAISEELKREKSNVRVSVLCPGAVKTNFNKVAGFEYKISQMNSYDVAVCAVDKMFRGKTVIIPGWKFKIYSYLSRLVPTRLLLKLNGKMYYESN